MQKLDHVLRFISALLLLMLISLPPAEARIISPWSIDRLAKEARLIVVGEVENVVPVSGESREENGAWIQEVRANVKILRIPASSETGGLLVGDEIIVSYDKYDWSKTGGVINGYQFPEMKAGECYALPLRKSDANGSDRWQLIGREDFGLIVPCLKQAPKGPAPETTKAFILDELANVLAFGDSQDISRTAHYLIQSHNDSSIADLLHERIEPLIEDDTARWLDIAVIVYNSLGIPRLSIADLQAGKTPDACRASVLLVAKALSHVPKETLDEQFIKATIDKMDEMTWGAGQTISHSYASHPLALSLLIQRLKSGNSAAIVVARQVLRANPDKALLQAALDASMRLISNPDAPLTDRGWGSALQLVRDSGTEEQFKTMLNVFEKSLKEDHERFVSMWQSLANASSDRAIPIIRIAIRDNSPLPDWQGVRISDLAACELQRVTGVQFGANTKSTVDERNKAIEKAKQWLSENP